MTIDLQPRLLEWARERAGLTAETLAEKLGVSAEKVAAWELDGRRFASALIASTLEGKTLFRDAMSLLDMKKTATFQELVSRR